MFISAPPQVSESKQIMQVPELCGEPLWSARWSTCSDVLQTRHSCPNIEPGQAEAWPSAIRVAACSGIRLFEQCLFTLTCLHNSLSFILQPPQHIASWALGCWQGLCLSLDKFVWTQSLKNFVLTQHDSSTSRLFDYGAPFCINLHPNSQKNTDSLKMSM